MYWTDIILFPLMIALVIVLSPMLIIYEIFYE